MLFSVYLGHLNANSMRQCIFVFPKTSMSAPLRMVAVRHSAPTQRAAMSAAATVDMP